MSDQIARLPLQLVEGDFLEVRSTRNVVNDIGVTHLLFPSRSSPWWLFAGLKSCNHRGMSQIFPRVSRKFSESVRIGDK